MLQFRLARAMGSVTLGLVVCGLAAAQGADNCGNATPIAGVGTFAFDNSGANLDGNNTGCNLNHDVWFAWTAPATDTFSVTTCGLTGIDSMIAAYAGTSCPNGSPLACNDDSCGLQSNISFSATSGSTYLLRIGTWSGASGGSGSFEVIQGGPPGGCSNYASGPDVIVGDVSGCNTYGQVGGMSGYSLGTTSCNLGDQELSWIANSTDHPVIAQNIYRLEDRRFEQVGQSWLKHGFTALQGTLCCTNCQSSGTGSRLGVGCSDPYGAGLNGSQGGLGPRFEVNAWTGLFAWPHFADNQTGDSVYKRIQVPTDDVNPSLHPNALYFGEAQYVAKDDAAALNHFNNASWRPLSRPGGQTSGAYVLSTTSITRREEVALHAWQENQPTVQIENVDVPGEGRFVVASDVTDNGDGTWTYDYAIMNLNSHFSGQSFRVPVGSGAAVTDIGMSFPHYHSGEPYSNVAWSGSFDGSGVEWESETFAQDPDGNALRWGTTYSFWFTANTGPESKSATLGLFRPGNPGPQSVDVSGPTDGGGGPIVTNYCTANNNSTGTTGKITAQNFDLVGRTMELDSWDLPLNSTCFYITSMNQAFVANPGGSSGNLCVGQPTGRYVGNVIGDTGATGTFTVVVDLDDMPQPTGSVVVMPGDTWNCQLWHRDSVLGFPTSNFTNGVEVQFP